MSKELTQKRLKEVLHYDPETGVFTWRVGSCNRWPDAGRVTGTPDGKGYLMTGIAQKRYKLHRLVFLYQTGAYPTCQVDHINGDVTDNRWVNLRLATGAENMQNRKLNCNSSSGYTGVSMHSASGDWMARIGHEGRRVYLGTFKDKVEAYAAYLKAKAELHTFNPTPREVPCAT